MGTSPWYLLLSVPHASFCLSLLLRTQGCPCSVRPTSLQKPCFQISTSRVAGMGTSHFGRSHLSTCPTYLAHRHRWPGSPRIWSPMLPHLWACEGTPCSGLGHLRLGLCLQLPRERCGSHQSQGYPCSCPHCHPMGGPGGRPGGDGQL